MSERKEEWWGMERRTHTLVKVRCWKEGGRGQEWRRTEMWAGQTDGWTGRYEKVSDIHRGIHVENNSIK